MKTPVLVLYIPPWLPSRLEVILGYETFMGLVQLVTTSPDCKNSLHQVPEDPLQSRCFRCFDPLVSRVVGIQTSEMAMGNANEPLLEATSRIA